jgi:hypothetical protein
MRSVRESQFKWRRPMLDEGCIVMPEHRKWMIEFSGLRVGLDGRSPDD